MTESSKIMSSDKEREIKSEVMGRKLDCGGLVEASHMSRRPRFMLQSKNVFY